MCSESADVHLTVHWIKEVEIAKSIDELVTSRLILGRTDFSDYDMLDAMITSAWKKPLDKHGHFRIRVSKSSAIKTYDQSCDDDKLLT